MRCAACRRPLTNPVSLKHGLGPDCLKKAVKAGTAPLEALEHLTAWQRSRRAPKKTEPAKPAPASADSQTGDLFEAVKAASLKALHRAVVECLRYGINVTLVFSTEVQGAKNHDKAVK